MALRFTVAEALARGLISSDKAKELKTELQGNRISNLKKCTAVNKNEITANEKTSADLSPQEQIFNELTRLDKDIAMWEVGGLVPGRRYRADIYLPESRVVVEMDGFIAHRGKEQFKVDREKRNLLVMSGYPVIAFYFAQVKNNLPLVIEDILTCHEFYKPLAEEMFWIGLKFQLARENRQDLV